MKMGFTSHFCKIFGHIFISNRYIECALYFIFATDWSVSPRSSPHPAILETDFAIKAGLFETVAQHPEWFWSDKLKNLKDAVYRATQ